jgi:iron complex outermembrane receptor protein
VTAVGGQALANAQINDSASLVRAVPSLTYQQGNNPSNSSFRIRGIGTSLFGQGIEPAVSVVVDGVVMARAAQGFADLADIERVEVLRGPQGTLFGKNATAGVINIVTQRPSSEFGGRIEGTVAEQDEYRVKGTVSGPITSTLRGRLSGFYNNVGGNIHNAGTGEDTNGFTSWGVRGKLDWQATPNLTFLLSGDYRETDAECCSRVPVSLSNPALQTLLGSSVVASSENRTVSNDDASYVHSKSMIASLQADWDIGPATITSISAYQRYQQVDQFEPDQIVSDPVRFVGASPYSQWNTNVANMTYEQYSQELRLGSNGAGDLTYVLGGYYAHFDMDRGQVRRRARCASGTLGQACAVPLTYDSSGSQANFKSDNVAAFGQVDYRILGGLHILGGARVQYEKQTVTGRRFAPLVAGDANFPGITNDSGTRSRQDTAFTGKAGLRYEFDRNLQAYASYTRGYKAFALDVDAATSYSTQTGLDPEHVNAYELGLKWRAPGGVFEISSAVFRSDYSNLQVQTVVVNSTTGVFQPLLLNAGKSRSQGLEIEATMRPSRAFSVAANFTYLDATIDVDGQACALQQQASAQIFNSNFPVNSCYRRQVTVNGTTQTSTPIIDVRGGALPAAPKFRVGITPRYENGIPGTDLSGFIQVGVNFQSKTQFALEQDPLRVQKAYTLVDASVGISGNDRWNLTLFVRNLFDTTYYSQISHGTLLATTANPNDLWANINKDADRYFGATFGLNF